MLTHSARFKREALDHITGSSGDGRIHTYIHKVPFALRHSAARRVAADRLRAGLSVDGDTGGTPGDAGG